MRIPARKFLLALPLLFSTTHAALKIAAAASVLEWTPALIAKEDILPSSANITIINGGVPSLCKSSTSQIQLILSFDIPLTLFNLVNDSTVDLACNAETQTLRNYANHKNLRIIYTIVEVAYRIVADKRRIPTATALKGKRKRIGVMAKTSSEYFVEKFMASKLVDARRSEYELVNGKFCNVEPCGNDTLPEMLRRGEIDAVGFWEPTVELAARAIGKEEYAIFFSDFAVYREIYSLHSTVETLANPEKRKEIVQFIRALEEALKVFTEVPEKIIPRAAEAVGLGKAGEELLKAVWDHHRWSGGLPSDLYTVLVEEDKYTARVDNRTETGGELLKDLIDKSILEEVRAGSV